MSIRQEQGPLACDKYSTVTGNRLRIYRTLIQYSRYVYPPSSHANELRIMRHRHSDNADGKALIWEVKRLHPIVLRTDQLKRNLGAMGGIQGAICRACGSPR